MKDYVGVITALLGLMTAWLAYRTTARRSVSDPAKQQPVRAVLDPTVDIKQWPVKKQLSVSLLGGVVLFFLMFITHVVVTGSFSLANLLPGAIGYALGIVILTFRRKSPSRVKRAVSIVIAVDKLTAIGLGVAALRKVGAHIGEVEAEAGIIRARMPLSFWSWGNIITLSIDNDRDNESNIMISSDAVSPGAMFDFGYNARIVRKIKSAIIEG
jgi:hypothetical protein